MPVLSEVMRGRDAGLRVLTLGGGVDLPYPGGVDGLHRHGRPARQRATKSGKAPGRPEPYTPARTAPETATPTAPEGTGRRRPRGTRRQRRWQSRLRSTREPVRSRLHFPHITGRSTRRAHYVVALDSPTKSRGRGARGSPGAPSVQGAQSGQRDRHEAVHGRLGGQPAAGSESV